ncbi:hypothetical protein HN371_08275 [Candidatus Poribacteria bacterium]|jgi:signal transduction histidine kinase|nr:hypothetical protein [Candidatus Poribacteria bacterium]MBT5711679.1 hypothetical protein [Candidatus Poribacteria bacterium]MBT7808985.1 hypothetical protein [Candidatus Poribacteria bacterium]
MPELIENERPHEDAEPRVADGAGAGRCAVERVAELERTVGRLERELAEQCRTESAVRRAAQARTELLRWLLSTQEREYAHIAQELRERTGQLLASLLLELKVVRGDVPSGPAHDRIENLRAMVSDALDVVRSLATDIRPWSLDHLGLTGALEQDARSLATQAGAKVDFHADELPPGALAPYEEIAVYRAVQATLDNIAHHAGAREVSVSVRRCARELAIVVEDDGVGFDVDTVLARSADPLSGLLLAREQLAAAGGHMWFESAPGSGTVVFIELPTAVGIQATG